MKVFVRSILLLYMLVFASFSAHKYYTSITKVEIDSKEQLIKIHTGLFVDDFEKVLKQRYDLEAPASYNNLTKEEKEYIERYVLAKFSISINRSPIKLRYLGCKLENDLLYVYIEGVLEQDCKRIDVENSLLMDLFTEQQNSIDITYKKEVKSLHLHAEKNKGTLFF